MEIALVGLTERLPDLARAGDGLAGLSFRDDKVIHGVEEPPVRRAFGPAYDGRRRRCGQRRGSCC